MGILNNPHLNENAKVAELRKAIADLPDAEKKDLHERLKDRKSHDPLAQQFHYRLSHHPYKAGGVSTTDQVLNALKPAGSKSQAPTQDSRSAAPGKGSSPSVTDAKTADARARDPILGQDATGLKPGESISAKLTTKQDITNPQAEMAFDFSKQITKDQAAAWMSDAVPVVSSVECERVPQTVHALRSIRIQRGTDTPFDTLRSPWPSDISHTGHHTFDLAQPTSPVVWIFWIYEMFKPSRCVSVCHGWRPPILPILRRNPRTKIRGYLMCEFLSQSDVIVVD